MGKAEIISALRCTIPWFVCFQTAFWYCKTASSLIFPSTYKKLSKADQSYWAASIVSTIHATMVTIYAAYAAYEGGYFGSRDIHDPGPSQHSTLCFRIFVGYLLSDSVLCLYYRNEWANINAMFLHHGIIGIAYTDFLSHGYAHNLGLACLLWEITTPFLNARWFFAKSGVQKSHPMIYVANGMIFTLLWFVFRIVLGCYVGIWIYQQKDQILPAFMFFASDNNTRSLDTKLHPFQSLFSILGTYVVAYGLQWFWFVKILKGITKILQKKNHHPIMNPNTTIMNLKTKA